MKDRNSKPEKPTELRLMQSGSEDTVAFLRNNESTVSATSTHSKPVMLILQFQYSFLDLPRGAEWMIRGAYTPSPRVQTAPFGRCWLTFLVYQSNSIDVCYVSFLEHPGDPPPTFAMAPFATGFHDLKVQKFGVGDKRTYKYKHDDNTWVFPKIGGYYPQNGW